MPSYVKHTTKMCQSFRSVVVSCGGKYLAMNSKNGIKDIYIVNGVKGIYVWHRSPSSNNVIKYCKSDLDRLSNHLGIYEKWKAYSNDNTIYMHSGVIGDLF